MQQGYTVVNKWHFADAIPVCGAFFSGTVRFELQRFCKSAW